MSQILGVIFPTIAGILFGSQFLPQKKLRDINTNRYNLSMILGSFIISAVYISIMFFIEKSHFYVIPISICILAGFIWQFGNFFVILSISEIGMSKTTTLMNLISVYSFIFGIIIYSEPVTIFKIIGLPLIILGAIITAITRKDENKKLNWKGSLFIIIATFIISIFNLLSTESMVSKINPIVPYYTNVFFITLGSLTGSIIFNLKSFSIKQWFSETKRFHLFGIFGGFIWCIGTLFTSYTLQNYGLSFGVPIIQSVMTISGTAWGIIYFKEFTSKKNIIIFMIGLIVSIIGIIIFSY